MASWRVLWASSSVAVLVLSACASSPPPPTPVQPPASERSVRPEALIGTWLFEMKRGGASDSIQHSLHFSMTNGIVAGSITGPDGNAREITNILLTEKGKVAWDLEGQLHFEGTLDGSSMKGTAKRSASRRRSRGDSGDDPGDSGAPPPGGGGGYGRSGYGRAGRGGRGGGSRSSEGITWSAYKSVLPSPESPPPLPTPKPSPPLAD